MGWLIFQPRRRLHLFKIAHRLDLKKINLAPLSPDQIATE